jgi:bisphosphoglycerate-dependent phosphoglycerate mutase
MSRVFLVRHGQAAFQSDDYDRLTDTGIAQCRQLARHWRAIGREFDLVYAGTFYNSGVSSLLFDGETVTIESLNTVSHLEQPGFMHLITQR